MTDRLPWTVGPNIHPHLRRIHVRQDSEGRWFWYHEACRSAKAEIPTYDAALHDAFAHAADMPCRKPAKSWAVHIEVDPDGNRERASWLCPYCKQYCASHNPCDCCFDEEGP